MCVTKMSWQRWISSDRKYLSAICRVSQPKKGKAGNWWQGLPEFIFAWGCGWLGLVVESGALDSCPPITRKQSSLSALTWTCPESMVLTHFCPFNLPVTDTLISDTEVNIWITNLEHTSHAKVLIRQLVDNQHAKYLLLCAVCVLCVYNMLHNVQL